MLARVGEASFERGGLAKADCCEPRRLRGGPSAPLSLYSCANRSSSAGEYGANCGAEGNIGVMVEESKGDEGLASVRGGGVMARGVMTPEPRGEPTGEDI